MSSPKDQPPINVLIDQGKIIDLEDVFTYLDPTYVQERSGIDAERFAEIRRLRGGMLVTEIHRLADAIGIPAPTFMNLLVPGSNPGD